MNIITGYRGEPHITSAQDRAGNQGSYGTGSYVLNVGNKLAATIASANEIRIADGAICHQGCLANIDAGTYDSVAINNGTQGMNRIDRIVARYTKNAETNVESLDLVVIEGTAVSGTPSAPAYNTGNIQNGDSPVDMPLYQVRLTGVTVASVTKEFDYVRTQKELDAAVSSLNSKFESGTWTPTIKRANISNATGKWRKIDNMVWCSGSVTFSNTQTNQGNIYLDEFSLPIRGGENRGAIGWGTIDTVGDLLIGAAIGNRNAWISVNGTRIPATKQGVADSTMQFVICYTM